MSRDFAWLVTGALLAAAGLLVAAVPADDIAERARKLHASAIVLDTHVDTPQRLLFEKFDLGKRDVEGHLDIPRMREGGLNAVFMSIWTPSQVNGPKGVKRALGLIDAVREQVQRHSEDLALATTAEEVRRARAQGKIAVLMGMEGGHMIDDDLGLLRIYAALGVRYLTLTHGSNTNWADSSTDDPKHNGLTPFGRSVVRELNRLGVLVDISHVSDKTFYDALEAYRGIADEIKAKDSEADKLYGENMAPVIRANERIRREFTAAGKLPRVSWEKIVAHIDHVAKLVGVDYVGLGSDFDGATMPEGMEDCSKLERITEALLRKGYSEADIRKILGENTLRVLEQAERVSRAMQTGAK